MADKTSEHKHCPVCGKSMASDLRYCSQDCEKGLAIQKKKQQRTMFIFMGVLVVLFIVLSVTGGGCPLFGTATTTP